MPKAKSRNTKTSKSVNRINPIGIIVLCTLFVIVGMFLVYRSFAAVIVGS